MVKDNQFITASRTIFRESTKILQGQARLGSVKKEAQASPISSRFVSTPADVYSMPMLSLVLVLCHTHSWCNHCRSILGKVQHHFVLCSHLHVRSAHPCHNCAASRHKEWCCFGRSNCGNASDWYWNRRHQVQCQPTHCRAVHQYEAKDQSLEVRRESDCGSCCHYSANLHDLLPLHQYRLSFGNRHD